MPDTICVHHGGMLEKISNTESMVSEIKASVKTISGELVKLNQRGGAIDVLERTVAANEARVTENAKQVDSLVSLVPRVSTIEEIAESCPGRKPAIMRVGGKEVSGRTAILGLGVVFLLGVALGPTGWATFIALLKGLFSLVHG